MEKTFTTLEALNELSKNCDLKFEHEGNARMIMQYDGGRIITIRQSTGEANTLTLSDVMMARVWTKVKKQPVTFLDAVKARQLGNSLVCVLNNKEIHYRGVATALNMPMVDETGGSITTKEILEGTWYIED